jgi:hypothetical protein
MRYSGARVVRVAAPYSVLSRRTAPLSFPPLLFRVHGPDARWREEERFVRDK